MPILNSNRKREVHKISGRRIEKLNDSQSSVELAAESLNTKTQPLQARNDTLGPSHIEADFCLDEDILQKLNKLLGGINDCEEKQNKLLSLNRNFQSLKRRPLRAEPLKKQLNGNVKSKHDSKPPKRLSRKLKLSKSTTATNSLPNECSLIQTTPVILSKTIAEYPRRNCLSPLQSNQKQNNKENHQPKIVNSESFGSLEIISELPVILQGTAKKRLNFSYDYQKLNKRQCPDTITDNAIVSDHPQDIMYEYMPPHSVQNQSPNEFLASKLSHNINISNNNVNNNNATDDMYSESNSSSHSSAGSSHLHHHHNHHNSNSKQISASSMATLYNIGNTCYLNSVVYTLRFAPYFLHNLHHLIEDLSQINQKLGQNKAKSSSLGRNVGGLQGQSTRSWSTKDLASMGNNVVADVPRTNRQIATEKLHELYNRLHSSEVTESTEAFHADTFLSAVQDVSSIFEGNQQQDAHEFLMCILDSIRETCQSLTKVITECPDIIMNGYVSLPEKIIPQPPMQPPLVRFFRKLNKEDKTKQTRIHSPSRDLNGSSDTIDGRQSQNAATNDEENQHKEKISEKICEKIKKLGLDFFTEDFEGVTVSSTKCLSCETVTEQKETMIDLSVPITGYENMDTIENSNLFIQRLCITREQFNSENKYRCEVCTGLTEAIRTVSYPVLPRLLIIQLKRFSGGMEKINSYIPTPFTMQCFCSKCCALDDDKKLHVYKLYSVITHVGATLSVGHYIAYTCSLEGYSDYMSCPKDKRKASQSSSTMANGATNGTSGGAPAGAATLPEKNGGGIKKRIFGRTKASSSGDVTKNVKNLNGSIKLLTNGIDKLAMPSSVNDTCPGLNCCGILMKNAPAAINGQANGDPKSSFTASSDFFLTSSSATLQNGGSDKFGGATTATAASKAAASVAAVTGASAGIDPTWYMCDDDKIKAMSQREFEELLSPNRKITITPYLLFYARTDVQ